MQVSINMTLVACESTFMYFANLDVVQDKEVHIVMFLNDSMASSFVKDQYLYWSAGPRAVLRLG